MFHPLGKPENTLANYSIHVRDPLSPHWLVHKVLTSESSVRRFYNKFYSHHRTSSANPVLQPQESKSSWRRRRQSILPETTMHKKKDSAASSRTTPKIIGLRTWRYGPRMTSRLGGSQGAGVPLPKRKNIGTSSRKPGQGRRQRGVLQSRIECFQTRRPFLGFPVCVKVKEEPTARR